MKKSKLFNYSTKSTRPRQALGHVRAGLSAEAAAQAGNQPYLRPRDFDRQVINYSTSQLINQ